VGRLKDFVKRLVGERGRMLVRRFGRLRWVVKARRVRGADTDAWRGKPLRAARYVTWDPEIDTYSYALGNEDELAEGLARLLGVPVGDVRGFIREAHDDPSIARDVGWHVWHHKRRPPLVAHQLSAYVSVRALKPEVCVETGILDGLGSRTILRALARNAAEGAPGRLYSFDVMPGAGWLVPPDLRERWTPIIADAAGELEAGAVREAPGFYLHDSLPDLDYQRRELEWAFGAGEPGAVVMTVHGWSDVLQDMAASAGGRVFTFSERPVDHFYGGETIAVARLG
jgi:hypothetical protein